MSDNNAVVDPFEVFMNLEDVKGTGFTPETKASLQSDFEQYKGTIEPIIEYDEADNEQEDYEIPDFSFLEDSDNPGIFEDDLPVEEEEENLSSETENSEEVSDDEYDFPDTYDVGLETVITLPDGRAMTIEELQNGYQADVDYKAREEAINQREADFNARFEAAKETLSIAELETDQILKSYEGWDWDSLAYEDPTTYATEHRYYEKMLNRKQHIINQAARITAQKKAEEDKAFYNASVACVDVLKTAIPTWNDALYEKLMNHVVDKYKIDPEKVLKWNDPSLFMMAYDSLKRDNGKALVNASIKGGRKSPSGYVNSKTAPSKVDNARALAEQKYAQGKLSQEDAFKFLED